MEHGETIVAVHEMEAGQDPALRAACAKPAAPRSMTALFFDLFKLRIGLVIAVTALAGAAITPGPGLSLWRTLGLFLGVALSAAAAGAFNQFHERAIDARMARTRKRAFVTGRLTHHRGWLLAIVAIGVAGVLLVGVVANALAAVYSALGAFTYAVVYTVWLKPRTAWNIVIGGLAGSFAVLTGAAAASPGGLPPVALAFAFVLFLWTPPHFWSLAIACREDYVAARVPMLPVTIGNARAAQVVYASTILLVGASLLPMAFGMGWIYFVGAATGGASFLWTSATLARMPSRHRAMMNFHMSLAQLTLLLLAAFLDAAWHGAA